MILFFILSFPAGWFLSIFIAIVLTLNYYLLKGKKAAWTLLLIWFIAITFSFNLTIASIDFWFDLSYGLQTSLNLDLGSEYASKKYISVDFLALIILFVHISSKKYFKKKTILDEIDDITGENTHVD